MTVNGMSVAGMGVDLVKGLLSHFPAGDITLEVITQQHT